MSEPLYTEMDRRAWDRWWRHAEERDPERVDQMVRDRCAEMERQFVFDQDKETDGA
jgi:hypothetical protein